ncbi:heat shock transcription factor, X-linked member 3-like [Thomomys bottae]
MDKTDDIEEDCEARDSKEMDEPEHQVRMQKVPSQENLESGNLQPQEPNNSSGEGTSGNNPFEPVSDSGNEGNGEEPGTSQPVPDVQNILDLYNLCYSVLLGSLLFMTPDELLHGEEDQEGEEEEEECYKCNLCEHFKDNAEP